MNIENEIKKNYKKENGFTRSFGLRCAKYMKELRLKYPKYKDQEIKWRIVNDDFTIHRCKQCAKPMIFYDYKTPFYKMCNSCANANQSWRKDENKIKKMVSKQKKTLKEKYGNENYRNSKKISEKKKNIPEILKTISNVIRENTCLEKHGVINISMKEEIKNKKFETFYENFGGDFGINFHKNQDKLKNTMYNNNYWIRPELKDDYELYRFLVYKYTRKKDLSKLKNFEKIGKVQDSGYHVDHIFSIKDGFENNIPIHIITDIKNLQIIPALENISKNRKSYFTKEELFKIVLEND